MITPFVIYSIIEHESNPNQARKALHRLIFIPVSKADGHKFNLFLYVLDLPYPEVKSYN